MCDKNTLVFGVEEDKCKVSIEFGHDPIGWDGASVTKGHVGMNDQRNLGSIGLGDAIILSKSLRWSSQTSLLVCGPICTEEHIIGSLTKSQVFVCSNGVHP